METPLSVYLKLTGDQPFSFLLESVEGGTNLGRYSFIGCEPDLLWRCQGDRAEISHNLSDFHALDQSPLESLRKLLKPDIDVPDHLPPSCIGMFGYLGYDMVRQVEDIPRTKTDVLNIPDGIMMRPGLTIVFDNILQMMIIGTPVWHQNGSEGKTEYKNAKNKLVNSIKKLSQPIDLKKINNANSGEVTSNITEAEFHEMVEKAREYIYAGDIFQVVLSQRFERTYKAPPIALYRALRRLNPSPFLFYLNMGEFQLVGSSPEILVRVRNKRVTIRPIAGTRKRGQTAQEDQALADDLLSDPKERAEHLMLLDLGRNDVGRISKIGSVDVTAQYTIELYSHVMHIVSNVEGDLRDDYDGLDALFAGFPAGTVSGAPKIRAMEIIDELEPVERKFYAGCVGYLGFDGSVDSCITLRTGLIKDETLYVQAGGGIVAASTPDGEYQESINKARALFAAADAVI